MALGDGLVQEVVQDGLGILRKRYPDLLALSAIAQVSGLLLGYAIGPGKGLMGAVMSLPLSVVTTAIGLMVFSGQVRLIAAEVAGEPMGFKQALGRGTVNLWPLFLTTILLILGMALGAALLVIPGIWFLTAAGLATVVTVMEGISGIDAIKESFRLTLGYRPDIVVLALVGIAVSFAVLLVVGLPVAFLEGLFHGWLMDGLISRIPTLVLDPLLPVGSVLLYLKLRRING